MDADALDNPADDRVADDRVADDRVADDRVAIVGAGPGGLFLARMIRLLCPDTDVDVFDRGGPDDVGGFGVALSDRTMTGLAAVDPETIALIDQACVALAAIEIRHPEATMRCGGFRLNTIGRTTLLRILRQQAELAGARIHYRTPVRPGSSVPGQERPGTGVLAIADGARSAHRDRHRAAFGTSVVVGSARYVWLGTEASFGDAAVMAFTRSRYGPVAAHCYSAGGGPSTVVVEVDEQTWRRGFAGARTGRQPYGGDHGGDRDDDRDDDGQQPISAAALDDLGEILAPHLDGHSLLAGRTRWSRFATVTNRVWWRANTVLLGDAAHTAHFTVGSGTKLALEDAAALAQSLYQHRDRAEAYRRYQAMRSGPTVRIQRLAAASMRWWETYGQRLTLPAAQFAVSFLSRTPAVGHAAIRARCPDRIADAELAFAGRAGLDVAREPLSLDSCWLPHRWLVLAGPPEPLEPLEPPMLAGPSAPELRHPGAPPARVTVAPAGDRTTQLVLPAVTCPPHRTGAQAAEQLAATTARVARIRAAGADAVLLLPPLGHGGWWNRSIEYAGELRAATGAPIVVCVPARGAGGVPEDEWAARVRLALLAARIDLALCWPMSRQDIRDAIGGG